MIEQLSNLETEYTSCNLCKKDDTVTLFSARDRAFKSPGEFSFVRCKHCGLVYINPRPTRQAILQYYPAEYAPYKKVGLEGIAILGKEDGDFVSLRKWIKKAILAEWYGYEHLYPKIYSGVQRFLRKLAVWPFLGRFWNLYFYIVPYIKGGSLLDLGCGSGSYLVWLKQLGWKVFGVEMDKSCVEFVRSEYGIQVYQGDFSEINLPEQSFDCINMQHFLEHIYQPLETLEKCWHLLRDDGEIIISLPNIGCLEAAIFKSNWYNLDAPRHLYQFDARTLATMLKKAGFRVTRIRYRYLTKFFLNSIEYFLQTRGRQVKFPSSWWQNLFVRLAGLPWSARHIMTIYARKAPKTN